MDQAGATLLRDRCALKLKETGWPPHASHEPQLLASLALGLEPRVPAAHRFVTDSALTVLATTRIDHRRRALQPLLRSKGREAHWLWQWKFRLAERRVKFDHRKFGWGWTDDTVSWVVPTALAILALRTAQSAGIVDASDTNTRVELGQAMLLDRACQSGGWNVGNPEVFGVPLEPHLETTAIALLGLQDRHSEPGMKASISVLSASASVCPSLYSLAWSMLAAHALRLNGAAIDIAQIERRMDAVASPRPDDLPTLAVSLLAYRAFAEQNNPFAFGRVSRD